MKKHEQILLYMQDAHSKGKKIPLKVLRVTFLAHKKPQIDVDESPSLTLTTTAD